MVRHYVEILIGKEKDCIFKLIYEYGDKDADARIYDALDRAKRCFPTDIIQKNDFTLNEFSSLTFESMDGA